MNEANELFSFLSRLIDSNEVITKDIEEEKYLHYLNIKNNKFEGIKLFQGFDEKGRTIILSVNKESYALCPTLPASLRNWIKDDYKDFHTPDVKPINARVIKTDKGEITIYFKDSVKRKSEYDEWRKAYLAWRREERKKEARHELFDYLYCVYEKMKRDDTYELYLGNGIFYNGFSEGVNYPLALRRALICYNHGFMELIDASEDTFFSEEILKDIDVVETDAVVRALNATDFANANVIESSFGENFLENLATIIHPQCRYSKDGLNILATDWFILYEKPLIFLRKKRNNAKSFLDKLTEFYAEGKEMTPPLAEFFYHEQERKESVKDFLLPKPISHTQQQALSALLSSSLVTVDAPPGTGGTQSIINFLTYFLSCGKKVLVISPYESELDALVKKLPETLKMLTMHYNKNSYYEIINAICAIAKKIGRGDVRSLKERIEKLKKQRSEKDEYLSEFKKKLKIIKENESKAGAMSLDGEIYSQSAMAKYLSEHENFLSLIPGRVKLGKSFAITEEELAMLYETNRLFTPQMLSEMASPLPKSEKLLTPAEFDEFLRIRKRIMSKERGLLMELPEWSVDGETILFKGEVVAKNIDQKTFEEAEKAYDDLDFEWLNALWAREAVIAGRADGEAKETYLELENALNELNTQKAGAAVFLIGNKVEISYSLLRDARISKDLEQLEEIFDTYGDIPFRYKFLNSRFNKILSGVKINNFPITSGKDVATVAIALKVERARIRLENVWQDLMVNLGEKPYRELAEDLNEADEIVALRIREIKYAINWYDKKRGAFIELLNKAGINTDKIIPAHNPFTTPRQQLAEEINWLLDVWPSFSALLRLIAIEKSEYKNRIEKYTNALLNRSSPIVRRMLAAISSGDLAAYKKEYKLLINYESLADSYEKRCDLLKRLADVAPDYAAAIACQKKGGAVSEIPKDILKAYRAKQFAAKLAESDILDFYPVGINNAESIEEEYNLNSELLTDIMFEKFLEKIEQKNIKNDLIRIAKGAEESPNARQNISDEERENFLNALPLSVLSIDDIFTKNYEPNEKFDVIFIDSAEGFSSIALSLLSLGDKVVIFGDRRASVSFHLKMPKELANARGEKGAFYKTLLNSSLYEIACEKTEPYYLKEEFRSPQTLVNIIGKIAYEKDLTPIKLLEDDKFVPLVKHKTTGVLDATFPVNFVEAGEVALLISACLSENEYQNKTFGVIAASVEQADTIFEIVTRKVPAEIIEKIDFMAGVPKDFAGLERDIIFLSLVDDKSSNSNALSNYELAFAVSRAKEQIFVAHSKSNFRENDPRKILFNMILGKRKVPLRAKTTLGREIANYLKECGFSVRENFTIGQLTLEIAVFGENRAAIIPLGDEEGEFVDETFLVNQNFKIIYVRGSKYYRNQKETLNALVKTLKENNITTDMIEKEDPKVLLEKVYNNLVNLREEYHM